MTKLYYAPYACSLACHVALIENDMAVTLERVDLATKLTADGRAFAEITPKSYVPVLELAGGERLTEVTAILQYIADTGGRLLPSSGIGRYQVLATTAFVATEIHRAFKPVFNVGDYGESAAAHARSELTQRFGLLAHQLGEGTYLAGDSLSIADLYLLAGVMWARLVRLGLPPQIDALAKRMLQLSSVRTALEQEATVYPAP